MPLSEIFNWKSTTPRNDVGEYIDQAFWRSSKDFEILSTRGIVPYTNARVPSADTSFVEELPLVPEPLLKSGLIKTLRDCGDLVDVRTQDILWILENSSRTRTPTELVSYHYPKQLLC